MRNFKVPVDFYLGDSLAWVEVHVQESSPSGWDFYPGHVYLDNLVVLPPTMRANVINGLTGKQWECICSSAWERALPAIESGDCE